MKLENVYKSWSKTRLHKVVLFLFFFNWHKNVNIYSTDCMAALVNVQSINWNAKNLII